MSLQVTVVLALASALAAVFCGWRGARPPDLRRGPRMIPWRALMALFGLATILLLAHLANLAGLPMQRR